MASTERKVMSVNKFSQMINNTNNTASKYRENRSVSLPKNEENNPHKNIKYTTPQPQTTTGYATHSKAFVFNDSDSDPSEDNTNQTQNKLISPKTLGTHRPQTSINLETNPLSKLQISQTPTPNVNHTIAMEDIIRDTEEIKINIDEQSYSSSYDPMTMTDTTDFFPPGYTSPNEKRERRKSNKKDIWRRMMNSVVNGADKLAQNAMNLITEEEDIDMMDEEVKYNNNSKYETVTKNNGLFRHNGYKIEHRLSSHEVLQSRYTSKCYRRKYRPRSKSDPNLLPHTKRFCRKLETEYRPGTMNIFMMQSGKKEKVKTYPTRAHQDSVQFRYLFDDSDFEDDSLEDWSDDELESLIRAYDLEVHDSRMEYKTDESGIHNLDQSLPNKNRFGKLQLNKRLNTLKDLSKSLPGQVGKGITKLKNGNDKVKIPIKPYGGHVEASENMISEEFGSIDHIKQYTVKKKNKLGRDKTRLAVLDIPLQVLRIKDKNGKTHKEHIVSSISDHAINGGESTATQIVIKFYDNRDYFLTFDTNQQCIEFRDLIEKLRKFNLKMITSRPSNNKKQTMSPGMTVGNFTHDMSVNDRSHSMAMITDTDTDGFYDDDDDLTMTASTHPNNGTLPLKKGARERFDTDMFEDLAEDGNVYTGMATSNVVYRIVKINRWNKKKERTMIVHKSDRIVRLFDDNRRCHSEYPLKIMATLDIIDSLNVEVVFVIDQKPTQFVFRSHIDLWDFVEQIRTIAPNEIMVNDRRMGGQKKKLTIAAPSKGGNDKAPKVLKSTKDMLFIGSENDGMDLEFDEDEIELGFDEDLDVNPNVLRYSVLRLIRSQAKRNQDITWRQHRRVLYLDLEKRTVRMLTLGMHIKDYKFDNVLLLEKSFINVTQLHMTCRHKQKIKEYWYEFVSPQARAEFVGRLLKALPGTKQTPKPMTNTNPLSVNSPALKPQIDIYANVVNSTSENPNVLTQNTITPRATKKKRRKRLSSEALRGLVSDNNNISVSPSPAMSPEPTIDTNANAHVQQVSSYGNLDVSLLDEHEMNGTANMTHISDSVIIDDKNKHFTENPLSIIVGSWNVSESEINFANLKMWIPPSTIEPYDLYVIGLQECAMDKRKQWVSGLLKHIDGDRNEYMILNKAWLMGIGLFIIVHRCHVCKISHLHEQVIPTGKGNIIGNKGATAISFQFQETSFVFINAHLAARAEKFEKRAKNFQRIIKNLQLGRPGLDVLHQFTHTFFIGDLNYRIEEDFFKTVEMVKKKKWTELVARDQLRSIMSKNDVFYGFLEGDINFCPTYRWERQKNTISNKREQPPSYCDRILYKSLPQTYDLWQECYLSSHRCFGSDHRPVWSLFKFKPKMPYFTLSSHVFSDNDAKDSSVTNISISLVELQAQFRVSNANKKIILHLEDEIDIILHYNYSEKPIRIKGGKFDATSAVWRWPIETLDSLRIKPFIPDPTFICKTHLFVSFVNCSKNNLCIGYAIISLFNAFPKSLIDTAKLIKEFQSIQKQMSLMPSKHNQTNDSQSIIDTQSGNKQFKVDVELYGNCVGHLSGFVYADGTIVDKHRKITNLDLLSKYEKQTINPIAQMNNNKYSLFQKASQRFNNLKK